MSSTVPVSAGTGVCPIVCPRPVRLGATATAAFRRLRTPSGSSSRRSPDVEFNHSRRRSIGNRVSSRLTPPPNILASTSPPPQTFTDVQEEDSASSVTTPYSPSSAALDEFLDILNRTGHGPLPRSPNTSSPKRASLIFSTSPRLPSPISSLYASPPSRMMTRNPFARAAAEFESIRLGGANHLLHGITIPDDSSADLTPSDDSTSEHDVDVDRHSI